MKKLIALIKAHKVLSIVIASVVALGTLGTIATVVIVDHNNKVAEQARQEQIRQEEEQKKQEEAKKKAEEEAKKKAEEEKRKQAEAEAAKAEQAQAQVQQSYQQEPVVDGGQGGAAPAPEISNEDRLYCSMVQLAVNDARTYQQTYGKSIEEVRAMLLNTRYYRVNDGVHGVTSVDMSGYDRCIAIGLVQGL